MKLSDKQRRFVEEYLVDLNGTQAAIRAGYSAKTARHQATRLLAKAHIQEAVQTRRAAISNRLEVDTERVLLEYMRIAFADLTDVAAWRDGGVELKPSAALAKDVSAAIAEVAETPNGLKVKMHDKKGALDSLARHLGLFDKDSVTVKGDVTLAAMIRALGAG